MVQTCIETMMNSPRNTGTVIAPGSPPITTGVQSSSSGATHSAVAARYASATPITDGVLSLGKSRLYSSGRRSNSVALCPVQDAKPGQFQRANAGEDGPRDAEWAAHHGGRVHSWLNTAANHGPILPSPQPM